MSELKRLAEAAKAKIEDGKPKSWWIYSIEEHEFAKAASPDVILALIAERDRLREALKGALSAMNSVTLTCECFHHAKKDRHNIGEDCAPMARFEAARQALGAQ